MEEKWEEIPNCIEFTEEFLLILSLKVFFIDVYAISHPEFISESYKVQVKAKNGILAGEMLKQFQHDKKRNFLINNISSYRLCVKLFTTEGSEDTELDGKLWL